MLWRIVQRTISLCLGKAIWMLVCLSLTPLAASGQSIELSASSAAFHFGEGERFHSFAFDDSDWPRHDLILADGWQTLGATLADHTLWQRTKFDGAEVSGLQAPALHLGVVMATEVFLNGVRLGGFNIYPNERFGLRHGPIRAMPQVYPIPSGLFRAGENVLAFRSVRHAPDSPGLLAGPLTVTELAQAQNTSAPRISVFLLAGSAQSVIFLAALVVTTLFWVLSARPNHLGWLALSLVLFAPVVAVSASLPLFLGFLPSQPTYFGIIFLGGFVLIPLLEFAARAFSARNLIFMRVLQASVALTIIWPHPDRDFILATSATDTLVWLVCALLSFGLISVWAWRSARSGQPSAYVVVFGAGMIFASLATSVAGLEYAVLRTIGTGTAEFAIPIFLMSLAWVGIRSVIKAQERLTTAQDQILDVQETEQRRVAYDLHDGVGQVLSALKLNLQLFQSETDSQDRERLSRILGQVDEAISDTRRIAHDLSPAMIESKGLAWAIHSHCNVISLKTNLRIVENIEAVTGITRQQQGQLYRIFQEALHNAIKHAAATEVAVSLVKTADVIELTVRDNGTGIKRTSVSAGLGLKSMRRRADILGAELAVRTKEENGTTIFVRLGDQGR